jgi:hypothetical protein
MWGVFGEEWDDYDVEISDDNSRWNDFNKAFR